MKKTFPYRSRQRRNIFPNHAGGTAQWGLLVFLLVSLFGLIRLHACNHVNRPGQRRSCAMDHAGGSPRLCTGRWSSRPKPLRQAQDRIVIAFGDAADRRLDPASASRSVYLVDTYCEGDMFAAVDGAESDWSSA